MDVQSIDSSRFQITKSDYENQMALLEEDLSHVTNPEEREYIQAVIERDKWQVYVMDHPDDKSAKDILSFLHDRIYREQRFNDTLARYMMKGLIRA